MHHFKGDPCCPPCCPIPTVTVGRTITTPPGTRARVTAEPTPCGVELEFAIPAGKPAFRAVIPSIFRKFAPNLRFTRNK